MQKELPNLSLTDIMCKKCIKTLDVKKNER